MKHAIQIINFTNDLKEPIKSLNYEWLEKYFYIEKSDELSLSNPKEQIIDQGGFIFYAKLDEEIVGTVSLLKITSSLFEIGKMAVSSQFQGHGIGTLLLKHCITFANENQIKTLILYSNTKLEAALHLYRTFGFTEVALEKGHYDRANIKMELSF